MTPNPFDQACRYITKKNPGGMRSWLLPGLPPAVQFAGWLDTRSIPFPGEPDRVCDTVAHLVDTRGPRVHWALPIEFQREPSPAMFGRLLEYLARLWLELRVPGNSGGRFCTGAAVVNLTGHGQASLRMELPGTWVWTGLGVQETDLASEDAAATLQRIAAGTLERCLLPWIPLMQGGNSAGIIGHWKALATAEADAERRGDWGGLVLVFADAVGTRALWKRALEGWNVETSQQVLEWQAEALARGKMQGKAEDVVSALRLRFGKKLTKKLQLTVMQCTDLDLLNHWFEAAVTATSLDAFRAAANL